MEDKEFMRLLADARDHLDQLDKIVKDAFKEEERMIQNVIKPASETLPGHSNLMIMCGSPKAAED